MANELPKKGSASILLAGLCILRKPQASGQDAQTNGLEASDPLVLTGIQSASLSGDFHAAVNCRVASLNPPAMACDSALPRRIRRRRLTAARKSPHRFLSLRAILNALPIRQRPGETPSLAGGTPHPSRDGLIRFD